MAYSVNPTTFILIPTSMKKISIRTLLLCSLLTAGISGAEAQQPWTLDQCIEYATTHSINIQQRALQIQKRQVNLETSTNGWLPEVNARLGEQLSFGNYNSTTGSMQSNNTGTNYDLAYTTGEITAQMNLFDGFKVKNQKKADRYSLNAATADLEKACKDIGIQIAVYYMDCLRNKSLVDVASAQLAVSQQLRQRASTLVEEGKRPLSELKDIEATVASDEYTLTQAKGDLTLALLNLAQLLNLPSAEGFDVAPIDESTASQPATAANYDDVVEKWPSILSAKSSIEEKKARIEVARSDYYPTLFLQGSLRTFYVNMFHQNYGWGGFGKQYFNNNLNEVVGLHLSIPIFNRFQTRSNIRMAKLDVMDQQLALDDARQNLRSEMQKAYTNAVVALDKQTSAKKAVEAAAISVSYEQDRYDAGRSSIFDLITAQQKYLKAQQDAVQSKYEYLIRQRILDFYR